MRRAPLAALAILLLAGIQPASGLDVDVWILTGPLASDPIVLDELDARFDLHVYEQLGMAAIVAPESTARALQGPGLTVWRNEAYELHLDQSVPAIGADLVKQALGPVRNGPTVLVIDTGLDSNHPDFDESNLAANVAANRGSSGLVTGVREGTIIDRSGHGSHVAGIIAGSGQALGSRDDRYQKFVGVYSNGRVASFQAATDAPDPEDIAVDLQAALEGFDWALQNQETHNIQFITNSWGSAGDLVPDHPAALATLRAYAAGMTVFFSAGNEGEEGTLNRHCLPPWVICVAAGRLDGTRASFSSMGNTPANAYGPYDHPDITAPGTAIRSVDPITDERGVQDLLAGDPDNLYKDRSGTSMAAPHAAGTAALLLAANPDLSPDQLMDILVETAKPMPEEVWQVGAGMLDARKAYNLAIETVGARDAFLEGEGVKYAGEATEDTEFAADPVTVGYDSDSGGNLDRAAILAPEPSPFITSGWFGWGLLGVGLLLVLGGIRFRDPTSRYEAPTGEPTSDAGGAAQAHHD